MPATYEDLLAVPELYIAEIVDGELFATRRPPPRGALAFTHMARAVGTFARTEWWVLNRLEFHLASDVLVPDIAAWRRSRTPLIGNVPYLEIVPDWVCDVLSPHNRVLVCEHKLPAYRRHGVPHVWIIDPEARSFEAWAGGELRQRVSGDGIVSAPPFDGFEIELYDLWPFPTPPPPQS